MIEDRRSSEFASALARYLPDSRSYYLRLPTDKIQIDWDVRPSESFVELAERLLSDRELIRNANFMDGFLLSAFFFGQSRERLPNCVNWSQIRHLAAGCYCTHLLEENGRPIRMRAARLCFFLSALIDSHAEVSIDSESLVSQHNPWDWDDQRDMTWIDCQPNSFHRDPGIELHVGKPTQLDRHRNGLALGSCYSSGGILLSEDGQITRITTERPIVMLGEHPSMGLVMVDSAGNVLDEAAQPIGKINCRCVWRARLIGDRIFVSDWTVSSAIFTYCLNDHSQSEINCTPVLVCNDVVRTDRGFAIIDKFQGMIFEFDGQWNFLTTGLCFGKGAGRLFDPISLKYRPGGRFEVLNWMTGTLVRYTRDQ